MTRAPPGPQLGTGRLRVDAARAIAKLRAYRLADRAAWVLEAIRAAVASGATRIALDADANDLWLCWEGPTWPAGDLPRLFDELVSPAAGDDRYHVRLLAAAVNSALGGEPAFVDVFAISADGAAVRARYTPGAIAEPTSELDDAPLRQIAVEPAAPPDGARPGMAIHLRRRFGFGMLSNLVYEAAELQLARRACGDLAVPLFVRGRALERRADLVRVPLGDGIRGFVAVIDPRAAAPRASFEIAEHGVELATCAIELDLLDGDVPIPIRVFVDGPRMPSNASRSEVRQDQHPISTVLRRVNRLLPELATALAAEIISGARPVLARDAAISLIASAGRAPAARSWLAPLCELPLARNAVGARRKLDAPWTRMVHTGSSPLPEELAPWLTDVPWVPPGDPSERLFPPGVVEQAARDLAGHLRRARRQLRAKRRFERHATRPAVVELAAPRIRVRLGELPAGRIHHEPRHESRPQLPAGRIHHEPRDESSVRLPGDAAPASCIEAHCFDGLTGEVCIRASGEGGELIVLLEGRELERATYESPIPFAAVIDAPRVTPEPDYRGAVRDAAFARVEAAMRGGVVRAVEALVAADARDGLAIHGLALARELAAAHADLVRSDGALFEVPIWPTVGGAAASTHELRRCTVLGVVAPGARLRPPVGRTVVEVALRDRAALAALLPFARIVDYDIVATVAEPPRDLDPALALLGESAGRRDFALVVRGEGFVAAIAPATTARAAFSHCGRRLGARGYSSRFVPCAILVDSDALIPDPAWRGVIDDGGLEARFGGWECRLLCATAEALVGSRSADLVGAQPVELRSELGRALCTALAHHSPDALLGYALAERLRAQPLLRVLGELELVSARTLAERFPRAIPYTADNATPTTGFAPLVADPLLAKAVGALAGRTVFDAAEELRRRRQIAARAARLTAHRARPALPFEFEPAGAAASSVRTVERSEDELDDKIHVTHAVPGLRALVGVARGPAMEIEVRVESRLFCAFERDGELPLRAIVDVGADRVDDAFEALTARAVDQIISDIREAAPALLRALAARPAALVEPGPVRTMLAAALTELRLSPAVLGELAAVIAVPTIQGERISLAAAVRDGAVATASSEFGGERAWLGPAPGESPSALDAPVLHLPRGDRELATIVAHLGSEVTDVTDAVDNLQSQRRMARGLQPEPVVRNCARAFVRRLADLGEAGAHGEIGLSDAPSIALIYARGELRRTIPLDVLPPIELAIEAPELAAEPPLLFQRAALVTAHDDAAKTQSLAVKAQALAARLVARVVAEVAELPPEIRAHLRCALYADRIAAPDARLFDTTTGALVDRAAITRQVVLFGDVWCIDSARADRSALGAPLHKHRIVLPLPLAEQALARGAGIPLVDGARELELDALARTNLSRAPAASLALDADLPLLASVTLDGDGATAPRGVVGILDPSAASRRGVDAHRALHPFDRAADPCYWPTLAIVDDARLAPDRTWSQPAQDAAWAAVASAIRAASDRALRSLAPPPDDALAHEVITGPRDAPWLAGTLWLPSSLDEPSEIDLLLPAGPRRYAPPAGVSLCGTLYAFPSELVGWKLILDELSVATYARLLRELAQDRAVDPARAAAHFAKALAHGWITSLEIPPHLAVPPAPRRAPPPPKPAPPPPKPAPPPKPERPPHPLDPLVRALAMRLPQLGVPPQKFAIVDGETDRLARFDGMLYLTGDHPLLVAAAAAVVARSAWAAAAVDAIAAHLVCVLNVALTSVTDATELHALGALLRSDRAP